MGRGGADQGGGADQDARGGAPARACDPSLYAGEWEKFPMGLANEKIFLSSPPIGEDFSPMTWLR
jgi:hypothetical protein